MKMISLANRYSTFITAVISTFLGLLVGAVMMWIAGYDPFSAYRALFAHSLFKPYDLAETIRTITPLILTGLAVAFPFRSGLFNIGVEGQFIIGQVAAFIVAYQFHLPPGLHVVFSVLAGAIAGGLWAAIPGFLKATRGVHEVISSIMMNFIALFLSNLLVRVWLSQDTDSTPKIPSSASLRNSFLADLLGNERLHLGIFIALLAAFVMYYVLWKTKWGYELRAVGLSPSAAEYAGISVKKNIMISMGIGGIFAGLAGAVEVLGTSEYLSIQATFVGIGFDGIAVALLGANTPIGVLLSSCLFGVLTYGGGNMQFEAGVPFEVIRVVFAAIILFIAAQFTGKVLGQRVKKGRGRHD